MTPRYPVQLLDLLRSDFRTTEAADTLNSRLQNALGFAFRYQPARLAIATSLSNPVAPELETELRGKSIKGETLFGQEEIDLALWVSLIVEHAERTHATRRNIQDLVAAHWRRGIEVLWADWLSVDESPAAYFQRLLDDVLHRQPSGGSPRIHGQFAMIGERERQRCSSRRVAGVR